MLIQISLLTLQGHEITRFSPFMNNYIRSDILNFTLFIYHTFLPTCNQVQIIFHVNEITHEFLWTILLQMICQTVIETLLFGNSILTP